MIQTMETEVDMNPNTPIVTEKTLSDQPKTEDPFEINLGDYELSEDETNELE